MYMAQLIVFEPDLLFSSRIESAAESAGVQVKVMSNLEAFLEETKQTTPRVVLVNLDATGEKLALLEEVARGGACKLVGYYSHVNSGLAEEARSIGIGLVLSRGAFTRELEGILGELRLG
jgi:ActR/RegA family two-component response regulator